MYRSDLIHEGLSTTERQRFMAWFKGNESAVEFCDLLVSATHVWDDLIDQDGPPPFPGVISKAFMALSIGLMRNDFFAAHVTELLPLLEQAMYDWLDANELEQCGNLPASFTLRCAFATPMIRCAYIIGGHDWGSRMSLDLRTYLFDDWTEYQAEHGGSDGLAE